MVLAHNVHASSSADAVSTFDVRFLINAGLGFIEAENFFPLAEELKDFLDDPLAFVTDTPVAADITSAPAAAVVAPVKMESKEGS
ncbi:hypothetical protein ACRRTK_010348 [Alexandromys fortis]